MDSPKLKPCPHCGGTHVEMCWDLQHCSYVLCHACLMQGPGILGDENAAKAWNALPRRHEITPNSVDCQGCPTRRDRSHDHD